MTPKDFITALAPAAQSSMIETKIPASFVIAEGALESAWGNSGLYLHANNMFGVKADISWKGDIFTLQTREFLNGVWVMVPAKWRKYETLLECVKDHAKFFQTNKRYKECFKAKTGEEFGRGVAKAGYATDPLYGDKIATIIRQHSLTQYDEVKI